MLARLDALVLREHPAAVAYVVAALVDHAVGVVDPRTERSHREDGLLRAPRLGRVEVVVHLEHDILSDPDRRGLLVDLDVALLEAAVRGHLGIGRRRRDLDLRVLLLDDLLVVAVRREEAAERIPVHLVLVHLGVVVEGVRLADLELLPRILPRLESAEARLAHPQEVRLQPVALRRRARLQGHGDVEALGLLPEVPLFGELDRAPVGVDLRGDGGGTEGRACGGNKCFRFHGAIIAFPRR